ncbi:Uncharacterised protein (plasmid) [Tsukamurella tyrosinosolvens]|uniref:Uncharacterized protein n=1 Tax=Tsukamurella tyrosinosolvens TaxID=57704 RepID=A0A1H4VSL3_TSUTY|nr:hypothetical protein [Tsukamurella tyrosinosolvens]KXO90610.1 hypothetical protein AXK58_22840 [Tsukamurella tyrosinosolvens]SEC84102.1 hypothetical protein SAMN04489793_3327 [Tsukamurella tyrosinosolvens]VEH90316.1 Uncharacterised protein [Tsukamurella tyrosinosolvens]
MTDSLTPVEGITVHAFIRPSTPPSAGPAVVSRIVDMHDAGILGPGSEVWCNLDVPNALWVLDEVSSFVTMVDVPTAGWVRLTHNSATWGRRSGDTGRGAAHGFSSADMPIPAGPHDTITVLFRNSDRTKMRAQFGAKHHPLHNYEISHGMMRVIDMKTYEDMGRTRPGQPSEWARHHAGTRGIDLMASSTGAHMHKVIRENLDAFTTVIDPSEFERIRAAQQRISQNAERVIDPIIQKISQLDAIGPYLADADAEESEEADVEAGVPVG